MELAAYHPDIPEMRMDYARYTAGVMGADQALAKILDELEKDGLADDTIVDLHLGPRGHHRAQQTFPV